MLVDSLQSDIVSYSLAVLIDSTDWLLGVRCCAGAAARYCLEGYSSLLTVVSRAVFGQWIY